MANELNLDLTPARTGYTMTVQLLLDGALYGSPIAASEPTPGYYTATMTAPAGDYAVRFIVDSTTIGTGFIRWDGTAEILDTPGTSTLLSRLSETRAGYLDAAISSRSTFNPATDPVATVTSVTNAVVLPTIPTDWITATGIASNAITSAKIAANAIGATQIASAAITSAKFATDAITADKVAADAVTEIQSGLATAASVAAIPTNPLLTTDARLNNLDATISSRSTFNAATDAVIVATNNDKTGYVLTQAFPANFAALDINASGHVSRVTLVDTTTTNTDMRGTDGALISLGSVAPLNWINADAIATDAVTEIQSGLATASSVAAIPTNPLLTTDTRLNTLDAAISSRLAAISYTEPLTVVETANAVTDALTAYPVATLAQVQAAGFTTGRDASLVATEAAAKAVADGRHKIDYLAATATQYDVDGNPRTVFDLLDQDGNPATTAQAAVERVPQP